MESIIKKAQKKHKNYNKLSPKIYNLPIKEFISAIYDGCGSQTYGKCFVKKLIKDSSFILSEISPNEDKGDCTINNKIFVEIKISYYNNSNNGYGIHNIRDYQDFDYFFLCFVNDKMTPVFYCVTKDVIVKNPILNMSNQNGTKFANLNNDKVGKSVRIKDNELKWILGKHNLLKNTTYKALIDFIKNIDNKNRNKKSKISFQIGDKIIKSDTNKKTMGELIEHINSKELLNVLWPSQLEHLKKNGYIQVDDGVFFNPRLSYRDVIKLVKTINKNLNLKIETINNK